MIGGFLRTTSCLAMIATAGMVMGSVSAKAADLGGNCCADLEERVAELEATTARKGNRKVSLQIYGQVSETVMWWNDGAESNVYVNENNNIKNTLGFQGSAKVNSDWSAGFKMELQIRAYRSSAQNQFALGTSNNSTVTTYNTQSVSLRHAYWFLKSNTYGTVTVGRDVESVVGTSSISLVNPDGFSGPSGPGFANGGFFLRRGGTTGNAGLSALTWGTGGYVRNGDGPAAFDYAQTKGLVKYTSPFFLGQTKSSGFQASADWGADDAWSAALRYVEDFGAIRFAAGVGYSDWTSIDRGQCSNVGANTTQTSRISCNAWQASASIMHVPTGLYVSGGGAQGTDDNAKISALQTGLVNANAKVDDKFGMWWIQGGWQAKLNPLGNTIFWGQYQVMDNGLGVNNSVVQTVSGADQLLVGQGFAGTNVIAGNTVKVWSLGVSQNIDAAAMTLYAGFHNYSNDLKLYVGTTNNVKKSNSIDDMQLFYTGATIKF